jgi:hypothetical protein
MYRPPSPPGILAIDTTDKFGNRVILEQSRYEEHIIQGHAEMKENLVAIKDSIENPYMVLRSKKNADRWLYFAKSENSTYPRLSIKTIVDHSSEAGYGFVVTSLFQKKVIPDKEGELIYGHEQGQNKL